MFSSKTTTWILNVLGGLSVLGSYAYGLSTHPGQGEMLWGTIPENVRGPYSAMMLPAAVGYLVMFVDDFESEGGLQEVLQGDQSRDSSKFVDGEPDVGVLLGECS